MGEVNGLKKCCREYCKKGKIRVKCLLESIRNIDLIISLDYVLVIIEVSLGGWCWIKDDYMIFVRGLKMW